MKRPPTQKEIDTRLTLVKDSLNEFADKPITHDMLAQFVRLAFHASQPSVKPSAGSTSAAMQSVEHLLGKSVSYKVLLRNMTRLLANWHFIRDEMVIPEWEGEPQTADAVFIGVTRLGTLAQQQQLLVAIKLKTGLCAGIITCAAVFESAMQLFLDSKSGTSKYKCAPEELAGMQARLLLMANSDGTLRILEWDCTDSQRKHNKDLAERRSDLQKCPAAPLPCNACDKNIRECPLAVWLPQPGGNDNGKKEEV